MDGSSVRYEFKDRMKRKKFHDYLKKRLTDEEIAEIERKAQREVDILKLIQTKRTDNNKEVKSTFEKFIESLSLEERKKYNEEYREFILSELILAAMAKDNISVRKLAKMAKTIPLKNRNRIMDHEESLLEALKDPEEALEYLNVALLDEDQEVFLLALEHILRAQQGDKL